METETTFEIVKLAAELDTMKLLGVVIFLFMVLAIGLVAIIARSDSSQNKTNNAMMTGFIGIITNLSAEMSKLSNAITGLSVNFETIDNKLEAIRVLQINLSNEHNTLNRKMDIVIEATKPKENSNQIIPDLDEIEKV